MISHTKKILAVIALLYLVGCSTIQNGTTQKVTFTSEPSGVEVYEKTFTGDKFLGVTPATLSLSKEIIKTLKFKKAGYQDMSLNLHGQVDKTSYWNVTNLMVGDTIDLLTGAKYKFTDEAVFVELKPAEEE